MRDPEQAKNQSFAPVRSRQIPVGGRPISHYRQPVTITKEVGGQPGPDHNPQSHQAQPVTAHHEAYIPTVQIGSMPPGIPLDDQATEDRYEMSAETLEELDFPRRLALSGDASLFWKDRFYNIELATLQRMVVHDLQHRLVRLVAHIHNTQYADEGAMDTARRLLDDYSTAIRHYDLMSEKKERSRAIGHTDPFLITTKDRLSFILMEREGLYRHTYGDTEKRTDKYRERSTAWDPERNMLPGESRTDMKKRNEVRLFFERFSLGVFGGLAIIAPMLIMALSNSLLISLVVTSATTMLFAVLLALPLLGGTMDGKPVLASVAAYAAILVVFVGTSLAVP